MSVNRIRLARIAAHIVVALIALVVIGGATRVMEAGLACPDWPLCFGSFLPGSHMNMQVFLEWFHRLDAFLLGIALIVQFVLSFVWRSELPRSLPFINMLLILIVLFQGLLGALTVKNLLPISLVTAHLATALTLVLIMSALTQSLLSFSLVKAPKWWRLLNWIALSAVMGQSLLGGRMASSWSAKRCLSQGEVCVWLSLHRSTSFVVAFVLLVFVIASLYAGGWTRSQWPYLLSVSLLLFMQIALGVYSVRFGLSQPILTVAHQLVATLMIALLSALAFRSPQPSLSESKNSLNGQFMEVCHG